MAKEKFLFVHPHALARFARSCGGMDEEKLCLLVAPAARRGGPSARGRASGPRLAAGVRLDVFARAAVRWCAGMDEEKLCLFVAPRARRGGPPARGRASGPRLPAGLRLVGFARSCGG